MKRCIQLAKNGTGSTYPNPLVGCVIVCEGKIIGEGWHRKYGEAHAEVNAIDSVSDKSLLAKSTLYVSLEPCCHFGKTPPCVDLILKHNIPTVIVGIKDPFAQVNGGGISMLRSAGVDVIENIIKEDCYLLNQRFFTFHNKKRPFVILKWAESGDGYLAPFQRDSRKPFWLTNKYSRQLVHKWRSEETAILIGAETAIMDNPSLTTRAWYGQNPVRILLDRSRRVSEESNIFDNKATTLTLPADILSGNSTCSNVLDYLFQNTIQSVIIEGGSKTLQGFIDKGLWDEARVFRSKLILKEGVPAPTLPASAFTQEKLLDDCLFVYENNV